MRFHIVLLLVTLASCAVPQRETTKQVVDWRIDASRCPVHDELLLEDRQPVSDGHASYDPSYYKIRDALFPCAYDQLYQLGSSADEALLNYCPKCRFAKSKYNRDDNPPRHWREFVGDADGFEQAWQNELDAFIARQQRELEKEYAKGR